MQSIYNKRYYDKNRESILEKKRVHYRDNRGSILGKRASMRQIRYGLADGEFDAMLEAQDNRCASCRYPFPSEANTHIDHCHSTGVVRGVLCGGCNKALGFLKDDPMRVSALLQYIGERS